MSIEELKKYIEGQIENAENVLINKMKCSWGDTNFPCDGNAGEDSALYHNYILTKQRIEDFQEILHKL